MPIYLYTQRFTPQYILTIQYFQEVLLICVLTRGVFFIVSSLFMITYLRHVVLRKLFSCDTTHISTGTQLNCMNLPIILVIPTSYKCVYNKL